MDLVYVVYRVSCWGGCSVDGKRFWVHGFLTGGSG